MWWRELEGAQGAAQGRYADHWVAVYAELLRTFDRMLGERDIDSGVAARLRERRAEARERLAVWEAFLQRARRGDA